ncbi:MAG: hypothetical protein L3J83_05130 [Proteobacteria bacterium]|nr:hypothetical protein [Pseudomonadota bacterium]
MRKILIIILIMACSVSSAQQSKQNWTGDWKNSFLFRDVVNKMNAKFEHDEQCLFYDNKSIIIQLTQNSETDVSGYMIQLSRAFSHDRKGSITPNCKLPKSDAFFEHTLKNRELIGKIKGSKLQVFASNGTCEGKMCKVNIPRFFTPGANDFSTTFIMKNGILIDDWGTSQESDDESYYPSNIIDKIESEHQALSNKLLTAIIKNNCPAINIITGNTSEECNSMYKTFGSHLLGAKSYKVIMNQVSKNNNEQTWFTYGIILKDSSKSWVEVNTWKDKKGIVRAGFRLH